MNYFDISLSDVGSHLLHMAVAYLLALPIGWNREEQDKSAGLRTFPLVAVGACAYMLVGLYFLGGNTGAHARVIYGIITGIGFIGGGAILKQGDMVRGTATAASIWITGAVGVAVALNRLEIALALTILTYLTLRFSPPLKNQANDKDS